MPKKTQIVSKVYNRYKNQLSDRIESKDPELVKQLEYFKKLLSGLKRPEQMTVRERLSK